MDIFSIIFYIVLIVAIVGGILLVWYSPDLYNNDKKGKKKNGKKGPGRL